MSTTTLTVNSPLASLSSDQQLGEFHFIEPDTTLDPWDCDYLAIPRPVTRTCEKLPLHDVRPDIFSSAGPYGLVKSGFTAVKHRSALVGDDFVDKKLIEEVYIPEVEELVRTVTGAKKVFTIQAATRSKVADPLTKTAAEKLANPSTEPERCGVKFDMNTMDLSKAYIAGNKEIEKLGPARALHVDFSPRGAAKQLRHVRREIQDKARDIIEAEDGMKKDDIYEGRRYTIYSVWRPLKTVKRDPLAICDGRTIDPETDFIEHVYKTPGENGDYLTEVHMLQANNTASQKWCYIKDQKQDEVLIIQFFDSHAKKEGRVVGAPHGSPVLVGNEEMEPRNSMEARCVAIW